MFDKNLVLISVGVLVREQMGKQKWFLIKQTEDGGWEMPKVAVRKGESSVRAILRVVGEKGGMNTRVLEEAGRFGGVTTINGETLPQKHIYYLMLLRAKSPEAIGFSQSAWFEYQAIAKKLDSKKEKQMFKQARDVYKKWKKEKPFRKKETPISF
jgi:ADP-ribose pyrophosphatase YjhB (NUDIX family)